MTGQTEAILAANARFYSALSLADVSAMRGMWLRSQQATCLHPGWNLITGYEAILQSWAAIFVNQGPVHIWCSSESVTFESGIAWVTCIEHVDATATPTGAILSVQGRNAFYETASGWKVMHHLAEPMAEQSQHPAHQRLALN
jgi:ketosteroid isomerase-like protein